jgi:hypothetical protein
VKAVVTPGPVWARGLRSVDQGVWSP